LEDAMAVTAFAAPILPGKTEQWKQAVSELNGSRSADWDEWHRRMGITKQVVCLQQTPAGDFAVVYAEGDDPTAPIGRMLASDHPFDQWFVETILTGVHGIDSGTGAPPSNEVFGEWGE
jgi:hypothetical protein